MSITHKNAYPSVVFWKYFKYGKHLSKTGSTNEQANKFCKLEAVLEFKIN